MLTEVTVIKLLCEHLAADGWKIVSRAMPNQRGTDVVATRAGVRLEVEADGRHHRSVVAPVRPALGRLGIIVFWVPRTER